MAALIPALVSAIMGSGANRKFDPRDPNSMPYEERKTGMGRFLSRLGGTDAGALNNQYNEKRGLMDVEQGNRVQLIDKEHGNRSQLIDKEMEGRKGLQTSGQEHDWKIMKSRLDNEAALQQQQQGFQSRLNESRLQEGRNDRATEQFNRYGSWDPIVQQDTASKLRDIDMTAPRPLGGKAIYNPADKSIYGYEEPGISIPGFEQQRGGFKKVNLGEPQVDQGQQQPPNGGANSTSISQEDLIKAGLIVPNSAGGEGGQAPAGTAVAPTAAPKQQGGFLGRILSLLQSGAEGIPSPLNRNFMRGLDDETLRLRSRLYRQMTNR